MNERICPKCGAAKLKLWSELTSDQKFLVEKLPGSAKFAGAKRKKHRFCTRCFFEVDEEETTA